MRFAHLSDLHFTHDSAPFSVLRPNLVETLDKVVADLLSIQNELQFISITGDLTETGDLASYQHIKPILDIITIPVLLVPGNHDVRGNFQNVFHDAPFRSDSTRLDYKRRFGKVQAIGLDTVIDDEVSGEVTDEQLEILSADLSDDSIDCSVISMHHPPFPTGHQEFDAMAHVAGAKRMGKIVKRAKSEVIILSGHIHRPYQARWEGASCFISGSPSFQMGSRFCFGESVLDGVDEPFAYSIHSITDDRYHSVGTRYLDLGPTTGKLPKSEKARS